MLSNVQLHWLAAQISSAALDWCQSNAWEAQVPVGSVRKGQSATLAIHPLSTQPPAANDAAAHSQPEQAAPAADGHGAESTRQQGSTPAAAAEDPPLDPHLLPDTALRIQRVSFTPSDEASMPAKAQDVTEAAISAAAHSAEAGMLGAAGPDRAQAQAGGPAVGTQAVVSVPDIGVPAAAVTRPSRQSPLGAESRSAGPFADGLRGAMASTGKAHRAAMPEGTLGVTVEDLDGLAAESQVCSDARRPVMLHREPCHCHCKASQCDHASCSFCIQSR